MLNESQPFSDTKEAVNAIGAILTAYLKSGQQNGKRPEDIYARILEVLRGVFPSSESATLAYERSCRIFLDNVIQEKGVPRRAIAGGDVQHVENRNSNDQMFHMLLPAITQQFKWCIENYRSQAAGYLSDQMRQFDAMLREFLAAVPDRGTKDKAIIGKIAAIKSEVRALAKWDRLFALYKANSFSAEVEYIFVLARDKPLAATWEYSPLDAQGEYQKTYDHQQRDRRVYVVRGNWATEEGLMKVGAGEYLDEISRPGQDVGCTCSLQWITSLASVPAEMLTVKGQARVRGR